MAEFQIGRGGNRCAARVAAALITLFAGAARSGAENPPTAANTTATTKPVTRLTAPPGTVISWRWRTDRPVPYPTRTLANLPGFSVSATEAQVRLSRYGGWADRKIDGPAPGFFRARNVGPRWWMVDPDGHLFFNVGMNGLSPGRKSPQAGKAFPEKFGTEEAWRDRETAMLRELGFNSAGAWSSDELLAGSPTRLAYTPTWSFMSRYGKKRGGTYPEPGHTGYPNKCIFVFDPEFEAFADEYAKQLAARKDDPWLLGHFTDNELPFPKDALDRFLELPESDPGHRAAVRWLEDRKGSARAARAVRAVRDLAAHTKAAPPSPAVKPTPPIPRTPALTVEDRAEFQGYVVDRYLTIVCGAIRRYDPNHMILGPRFYGDERESEPAFRAIGKHLDVVAVNLYHVWTPGEEIRLWERWSGRPVILTEWYAKGMDSGLSNISGAGWSVYTQEDRGRFYQNFTLGMLEAPACVGWHWFKYMDNDPTDPKAELSNQDSNKGIVRTDYQPYEPLVRQMRELNRCVYPLTAYFDERAEE